MKQPRQGYNTPTRPIRVDLDLWTRFGVDTERAGTDRSAAVREFMRWYVREAGARIPRRPPEPEETS